MDSSARTSVIKSFFLIAFIVIASVFGWSYYLHNTLEKPLMEVFQENKDDFKGIKVEVSYGGPTKTKQLYYNIKKIPDPKSLAPVLAFIAYAKRMTDVKRFDVVYLQYKGKNKFYMNGGNYANIGVRAAMIKPEELALDIPPMLKNMKNAHPYSDPQGDEQWVAQKKIHNFEDFLMKWYIKDWIEEAKIKVEGKGSKGPKKSKKAKKPASSQKKPARVKSTVKAPKTTHPFPRIEPDDGSEILIEPETVETSKPEVNDVPQREPEVQSSPSNSNKNNPMIEDLDDVPPVEPEEI